MSETGRWTTAEVVAAEYPHEITTLIGLQRARGETVHLFDFDDSKRQWRAYALCAKLSADEAKPATDGKLCGLCARGARRKTRA